MTENNEKTYIILNADKYRLHFWSRLLSRLTGFIVALALLFSFIALRENGEKLNERLTGNSAEGICRARAAANVDEAIINDLIIISEIFSVAIREGNEAVDQLQDELDGAIEASKKALRERNDSLTACSEN